MYRRHIYLNTPVKHTFSFPIKKKLVKPEKLSEIISQYAYLKHIPIRSSKYGANVHKMLLSYCTIQAHLIMPDVPCIMLQWCNNLLLNESPHISFTAIAELMAIEGKIVEQYLLETLMGQLFLLDFSSSSKTTDSEAALFITNMHKTSRVIVAAMS